MKTFEEAKQDYNKGNHNRALKTFLSLAKTGDANAQYYCGLILRKEDPRDSLKWFKDAAMQGHIEAQYRVGLSYMWMNEVARSVGKDSELAITWLKKAADAGHLDAKIELSSIYLYDPKFKKLNKELGLKLLNEASKQGSGSASWVLGNKYRYSDNEDDLKLAKYWYEKAYEQGDEYAAYDLAKMYHSTQKYSDALKWFNISSSRINDFDSSYMLGKYYSYGLGVQRDLDEALKWYQQATKKNHCDAKCELGLIYIKGTNSIKPDVKKGYRLLISASNDSKKALRFLEYQFQLGKNLGKKMNEELELLFEARAGNADAQIKFGYKYLIDRNKIVYIEEASSWYMKLASVGNKDGCYLLVATYYFGLEEDEIIEYLKKAALQGHEKAQLSLAEEYLKRGNPKAINWFLKLSQKDIIAKIHLGHCYGQGKLVERNYKKAIKYYELAMNQYNDLTDKYEKEDTIYTKVNKNLGNEFAEEEALLDNVDAQVYLGYLYEYGFNVIPNLSKSKYWYQMAAQYKDEQAIAGLKRLKERGTGVKRLPEHKRWINYYL